ncbi:Na+/H+ antiporter [Chelatococcus reniformis]|uniref:Sodium:proton antiporter n=1 Tax=Chelatococcus reniformis TaxID=1494448 RepID=A0A916UEU9_9HYPH|nr:Na+/H+ antiporter [Chelatococcus reniformis]GGC69896.1 sodium:proton antiporter [Chelatococcus reniformis]
MATFEWIIALLLAAALLAVLARRMGIPYPTLLALGGACLALLPQSPNWTLEPELALALFVAPVLLDAAYDTSTRDLRANWLPIAGLAICAVCLTTLAVAVTARLLLPEMPWAIAIALGAILAPPDAAAVSAVMRQVGLPHRLLKIIEGESLLNDATALLIYRLAIGTAVAQGLSDLSLAPALALGVVGSVLAGWALGRLLSWVIGLFEDAPTAIIVQFATTFGVWILAERMGLSAILTIVVYAIVIARTSPIRTPARLRVPAYAVWETVVFVLNAFAFVLIGMQIGPIWRRLDPSEHAAYGVFALAALATVVAIRFVWVAGYGGAIRLKMALRGSPAGRRPEVSSARNALVMSWSGMRGIVTLAAAFAIPETLRDGSPFPHRDLILLTAFVVVLGTLVIQGLTLKPLIRALRMSDDDPVGHEIGRARAEAYRAALAAIDADHSLEADVLRKEYSGLIEQADRHPHGLAPGELPGDPLRRRAIRAARQRAYDMRRRGEIGDDAYHALEEEFDWAELSAERN